MEAELGLVIGIIGLLLLLFLTVFGLLVHSGLFTAFDIGAGKPPFENLTIAYKFARGPYKNAGELFTEVHSLVHDLRTIGIYYDDPQEVSPSDLRYVVGAVLSEGQQEPNKEYEELLLKKGFKLFSFPAVTHAVTTSFPFQNTVSIFLAVARVYPKINEYIKERSLCAHPMIEVYEKNCIQFVAPLARQDEFYVPEAKEENSDEEKTSELIQEIPSRIETPITPQAQESTQNGSSSTNNDNPETREEKNDANGSPGDDSTGSSFEELTMDS